MEQLIHAIIAVEVRVPIIFGEDIIYSCPTPLDGFPNAF